jgi:hypothetical protein
MLRKTLALIIVVMLVSMLIGCNGNGDDAATAPIKLVPGNADLLMSMDVDALIEDEAELSQLSDFLGEDPAAEQAMGIVLEVLSEVNEVVLFGDTSAMGEEETYVGIIAEGSFTESGLIDLIEAETGDQMTSYDHEGIAVYADAEMESAIAFLSASQFVAGPPDVVEDVIDVKKGKRSAVGGTVLRTYNELGDSDLRLAIDVPPDVVGEALEGDGEGVPIDLSAFEDLQTVGMAADDSGESTAIDVQMCFDSADSAEEVEGLLGSLAAFAGMVPGLPAEVVELLQGLNISSAGSCVGISFDMTEGQFQALIEALTQISSESTGFGFD